MQLFCHRSMSLSAQITSPITSLNSETWCYHSRTSLTVLLFFKWMTGTDQSKSSLNKNCTLLETTHRQLKIYTFDNISVNIVHPLSSFTVFFTKEKEKKGKNSTKLWVNWNKWLTIKYWMKMVIKRCVIVVSKGSLQKR